MVRRCMASREQHPGRQATLMSLTASATQTWPTVETAPSEEASRLSAVTQRFSPTINRSSETEGQGARVLRPAFGAAADTATTRPSDRGREIVRSRSDGTRVTGLKQWTGKVVELDEDTFTAELMPQNGGPTVLADFENSVLQNDGIATPGDLIYVTVREIADQTGLTNRTSSVRLRRAGRWKQVELDDAATRARGLYEALRGLSQ